MLSVDILVAVVKLLWKALCLLGGGLVRLLLWLRATVWVGGPDKGPRRQRSRDGAQGPRAGEEDDSGDEPLTPTSVNYHFTRQCNYKCGFCFHTAKTSFVLPLEEAKRGLRLLQEAGESRSEGIGLRRSLPGRPRVAGGDGGLAPTRHGGPEGSPIAGCGQHPGRRPF